MRRIAGFVLLIALLAQGPARANGDAVADAIAALRAMDVTISDNRNWEGDTPNEGTRYSAFIPHPPNGTDLDDALELLNTPGIQENLYALQIGVGAHRTLSARSLLAFPQLEQLSVSFTNFTDMTELRRLPSLRELRLHEIRIDDLSVIAGARQITRLELSAMRVGSLAPLRRMASLRTLDLWNVQLADTQSLGALTQITALELYMPGFTTLDVLAELPELRSVELESAFVLDGSALFRLPALERLKLHETNIDMTPLLEMDSLRSIDIKHRTSPFPAAALCENLPALTEIRLREGFAVHDLTDFAPCRLRVLEIGDPSFLELSPLAAQTALEELIIGQPFGRSTPQLRAQDLRPLANLTNLRDLRLRGADVSDFTPLAGLINLDHLDISDTDATNIAFVSGLPHLRRFVLSGTAVTDLAPLGACARLQMIYVARTQVRDIRPLARCSDLRRLDVTGLSVEDFSPVEGLPLFSDMIGRR